MTLIQGHRCDGCKKIEETAPTTPNDELPAGWIKVILPGTTRDRPQELVRELCSGDCLVLFAMERAEADANVRAAA